MVSSDKPGFNTNERKKLKQSIFQATTFSENVVQDVNYNIKGSKENQRIAWEIKFNNPENEENAQNSS